jgi:2-keto-4-pentenoate hydratase
MAANKIAAWGEAFEPGDRAMPGSPTASIDVRPCGVVRATFDRIGHRSLSVSARDGQMQRVRGG